jgi:predicted acyltransferase
MLVPVPGFGAGRLDVDGNFAHYVDWMVLGKHNYAETHTWDPEGIVSTLPAIATVLFGLCAGEVLALRRPLGERLVWMAALGAVLLAAGLVCDQWLPINKKLWTSSFAVFMAGLDFVLFAGFTWVVDGLGWKRALTPFVILGMNAIVVYMVSELLDAALWTLRVREPIYRSVFAPLASPINASLLYALAYTVLMFAVAYAFYRRRWFIKV